MGKKTREKESNSAPLINESSNDEYLELPNLTKETKPVKLRKLKKFTVTLVWAFVTLWIVSMFWAFSLGFMVYDCSPENLEGLGVSREMCLEVNTVIVEKWTIFYLLFITSMYIVLFLAERALKRYRKPDE